MPADSVPIAGAIAVGAPGAPGASAVGTSAALTVKPLGAIFLLFLFVTSDVFTFHGLRWLSEDSVSAGGVVTSKGEIIRGLVLVLLFALVIGLSDSGIL